MNKQEFLAQLRKEITGLPKDDIDERLTFYSEMIEDRIEEGLSEEEAISEIGSVGEMAAQTIADTPLAKIAKERIRTKGRLKAWEIVLLVLGSPIWLSLGIAAAAVILALYVSTVVCNRFAVGGFRLAGGLRCGQCADVLFSCCGRQRCVGYSYPFGRNYLRRAFYFNVLCLQRNNQVYFVTYKKICGMVKELLY